MLPELVLGNVAVVVGGATEAGRTEDFIVTTPTLSAQNPSDVVYVSFTRDGSATDFPQATLQNTLRFVSQEVDPASGEPEEEGYDDEYQTEELELGVADYVTPTYANFAHEWDGLAEGAAATETFALTALDGLKSACDTLVELLGGSEVPTSSSVHALNLSGTVAVP
ncbi:coatomer subunit gamma [Thecaphora frezii]